MIGRVGAGLDQAVQLVRNCHRWILTGCFLSVDRVGSGSLSTQSRSAHRRCCMSWCWCASSARTSLGKKASKSLPFASLRRLLPWCPNVLAGPFSSSGIPIHDAVALGRFGYRHPAAAKAVFLIPKIPGTLLTLKNGLAEWMAPISNEAGDVCRQAPCGLSGWPGYPTCCSPRAAGTPHGSNATVKARLN